MSDGKSGIKIAWDPKAFLLGGNEKLPLLKGLRFKLASVPRVDDVISIGDDDDAIVVVVTGVVHQVLPATFDADASHQIEILVVPREFLMFGQEGL